MDNKAISAAIVVLAGAVLATVDSSQGMGGPAAGLMLFGFVLWLVCMWGNRDKGNDRG